MRDSIGWMLIGWYGLLLTAVLTVFGATLYWSASAAALEGTDRGLEDRAGALAAALELDEHDGWELDLSDDYLAGIGADTWFRITAADGALIRAGGPAGSGEPGESGTLAELRARGALREVERAGPSGSRVVVGREIAAERAGLRRLLFTIVGAGLGVLALALWGGVRLARRALAPVADMTATAASITARELSSRLDEERSPRELRGLARAFNGMLDRLQEAFVRQVRFTADASHELRTPVAIVRSQAELALQRERAPEEYREALRACLRGSERIEGVVEGLLALARSEGHATELEPVPLETVVTQTVEHWRPAAARLGVQVDFRTEPVSVAGDARLLANMVDNLVGNGVRYNRSGGSVDLDLGRENGCAILQVRDTGIGIPPEALPHVFERFYRVDPARSRERGGTGLGLSIARCVAEAHGGSIEVESRPGAGTTFTVRLPVRSAESEGS